jgi:hypothetical protein
MAVVATTLSLLWEPRTLPSSGLISRVANCCQVSTVETICFPRYLGDNNVHLFGNLSQYIYVYTCGMSIYEETTTFITYV